MKRKSATLGVFVAITLSLISCRFRQNNTRRQNKVLTNHNDTVKRQIPLDNKGKVDYSYKLIEQKSEQLKLDSIILGFDSLQIRVWFGSSMAIKKHLIIIKYKNYLWSGQLFTLTTKYFPSKDSEIVIKQYNQNFSPKIGWINFMKALFSLKITSLPNGPEGGMDGTTYCVEIATKYCYRFYKYWSPEITQKEFWGSKNMVDIITIFKMQSDLKDLSYAKDK